MYDSTYDSESDDNYIAAISSETAKIHFGNIYSTSLIVSGSVHSIITKKLQDYILEKTTTARWINTKDEEVLKYSLMNASKSSENWKQVPPTMTGHMTMHS